MSIQFRPIRASEVSAFCRIIDRAYAAKVKQLFGNSQRGRWKHYDEGRVQRYRSREPQGVRAGFQGQDMVSVCICRSYGSVGWFHSLGVLPQWQHQGIGRQAVHDAEAYLRQNGAQTVGLMTWPDAIDNLGFYLTLGYRPVGLSMNAIRQVQDAVTRLSGLKITLLSQLSQGEQEHCLQAGRRLSHSLLPGLDYSAWMLWTLTQSNSDVMLCWLEDELAGFAIAELYPRAAWLAVRLLVLAPDVPPATQLQCMEAIRRWAEDNFLSYFGLPLDLMNPAARSLLQLLEFRLFRDTMVDFIKGEAWPPRGVHMVRFSG